MPLVVPALRLVYVFLNVFDTFKTLRLPPPSARNNGRPSVRAMSQRKRAMKGCIAVWVVWGCFAMYERTADPMVRLFVPFYDEVKSLVILFFLLTRARGAEPIFLHVIRPSIKPYAVSLDSSLEIVSTFGDFLLLVLTIPVHFLLGYYRQWMSPTRDLFHEETYATAEGSATEPTRGIVSNSVSRSSDGVPFEVERKTRSRTARNDTMQGVTSSRTQSRPTAARAKSSGIPQPTRTSIRQQNIPPESAPPPPYEIWYPPATSYDASAIDPLSGLPTPPVDTPPPFEDTPRLPEAESTDEWRQYPAFPSAYPATPLPVPPRLPTVNGSMAAPVAVRPNGSTPFADILEEPMHSHIPPGLSDDADTTAGQGHQQDFHGSLPSRREFQDPDSAADSSDDHNDSDGVQHEQNQDNNMDVENDYTDHDDEEDDFDVTLRTPFPKIRVHRASKEKAQLTSTSTESLASRSTALSTTDNGSELRTRTNSAASTTHSKSDTSSVVGRKRRLPRGEYNNLTIPNRIRTKPSAKTLSARPTAVQLQARMRAAARERSRAHKDSSASVSADEDTADTDSDASGGASSDLKRRRVPGVPGDRLPRPAAARGDSNRTVRAAVRKPTINASDSRSSSRRPPSRVAEGEREVATVRSRRPASTVDSRTRSASRK